MNSLKSSNSEPPQGANRHLAVESAAAGTRVDKWLSMQAGFHSREMARGLIDSGAVLLNGATAAPDTRVKAHDLVEWSIPPPKPMELRPEAVPLTVRYEDSELVVIDKPAGLVVHPGPGHSNGTLVHFLLAHCENLSGIGGVQRPGIVHRLDKDTSGVLVVAKNDRAHQSLSQQFRAHSSERAYLAIVVGCPREDSGRIDLPLGRDIRHRMRQMVRPDGRRAVTHWYMERRLPPFSLMRLKLETGRTHQIRAHLCHQDWPVLCDPLYGRGRHRGMDLPPELREALHRFRRQALHAVELGFRHPVSSEWMWFQSPLPPDMASVLDTIARMPRKAS